MWVEMLWIPAFAGMTKETDGFDLLHPYICHSHKTCNSKLITCHSSLVTVF
ncbi:MAG: hypothetical protein U9O91_00935 [Candidatus Caldatribacteriota bacterium]|nr:hypothetical protein [Candidatus Caldatribacteriota bacterium]